MKIRIQSKVIGNWRFVFESLNKDLFIYLLPPGARLIRLDGSTPGDIVHLEFNFPRATWISEITRSGSEEGHAYFIDQGKELPYGLKAWRHKHNVYAHGLSHSLIVDEMEFSTGNAIMDLFYYPMLYLAFLPRKWQYSSYFRQFRREDH